jgi:hypothetical protein
MVPIVMALQAALAAVEVLRQLGYLKPKEHEQVMQTLVNAHVEKPNAND